MARAVFVAKARKDNPVAKAGESYFWWKFRFGGKHYSKERPRPSQLTQSEFLGQLYSIQEEMQDAKPEDMDDLRGLVEDWASQLRELGEEQEEKQGNMPDALQDSPTGELLQERAAGMEEMADELESIDLEEEPGEGETKADLLGNAMEALGAVDYNGE